MDKQELINFEKWCVDTFKQKKIRSPIHLSGGNEDQLIKIFKKVKSNDWIFTTYRSHYHALLKGVEEPWLKNWIKENKSIHLMNKPHKIVSSALVGGTLSQAVGCAMAIKRNKVETKILDSDFIYPHVWAFCGDMTATLGVFHDCMEYSLLNDLPITFVIEDNGLSTDTPTADAWGADDTNYWFRDWGSSNIIAYNYNRTYGHYGVEKEGEERVILKFDD